MVKLASVLYDDYEQNYQRQDSWLHIEIVYFELDIISFTSYDIIYDILYV